MGPVSGMVCLLVHRQRLLGVFSHGGAGGRSLGFLVRALIPFLGALSSCPSLLPTALPPNTLTGVVRISLYEFGGGAHSLCLPGEEPDWLLPGWGAVCR